MLKVLSIILSVVQSILLMCLVLFDASAVESHDVYRTCFYITLIALPSIFVTWATCAGKMERSVSCLRATILIESFIGSWFAFMAGYLDGSEPGMGSSGALGPLLPVIFAALIMALLPFKPFRAPN